MEPPALAAGPAAPVRAAPGAPASLLLPPPLAGTKPFTYRWSRAGASLDDRFTSSEDAGGVRLSVSAAQTGDSGVYTLQASNAAGSDTCKIRLEVSAEEAPIGDDPPAFLRRLQDLTVKVGSRTRFLVEIISSTECKVTWYRNERRLLEAERVALARDGNFWCADVAAVSVDDAGRWTCTAENAGGRASCSAHLNVLVPKAYKRPEFMEELRALLTEQGTVSLECKVVGVPTPVLRWFKDSREIKAGDVFALTANAEDPTSLGTYTCEAVNCMGRAYSSSKVHVVGRASREGSARPSSSGMTPEPPPIFTKELEDAHVKICEHLTLGCHIVVPPWPRSVVWYNKEGKLEPGERYHAQEDGVGGYLLDIPSTEWADEGEWKCVATSAGGRVGITTCYVAMDVPKNYRKPRFMENLQAVLTEEGLVSFECKVVGFPTPVLSWFKDGQELKPGDVYQLTGTNSLGSYCCIARNCMGKASSSAELTVEDIQNQLNEEEKLQLFSKNQAPKFIQGLKSVEAKIDEPFRFIVKVAIPPEPSVLWYRDDQPVDESNRCHLEKEDKGIFNLDIQNLEFLDQAEWKCVAMNDFGHSVTSCFLKLIIPRHYKKPRFLENLQAILSDEGAVNLECKVIGVPQPVLKWYKDGEELKPGDIHRIISGQDGTCCLGTYTCEAQNCMGIAASSASLLGFDDSMKAKAKKSEDQALQRNLSLSTIHEERTSQMYDTPVGDITLDDKGEISFSFDGKEVSVSLYETPDLTEEEALQIVEMYADQLSENVTEHNVVELPPLRFVKETSTSGNLLMEAIIIDVSPEYFPAPDERTEADVEDLSIADENGLPQLSLDQDIEDGGEDYLQKTMALLSDEKSDFAAKSSRKKSDSQRSIDDFYSLSRDQSLSEEKHDDDTHVSESELQSFASARSSAKFKSKSSKPSDERSEPTKTILMKEEAEFKLKKEVTKPQESEVLTLKPKRERRTSRGSRRSSTSSEKSIGKSREELLRLKTDIEQIPKQPSMDIEEFRNTMGIISTSLTKVINDVQLIERDIILKSELMSSAATASRSLEIISSLITPLSEINSIADAAKESVTESREVASTVFNTIPQPLKALQQSLTIIEKCIDMESDNKTLVKKTCVAFIETCGTGIQKVLSDITSVTSKDFLKAETKIINEIDSVANEMTTLIKFSTETIKARNLLTEASEIKQEEPTVEAKHLRDTQKAVFELKTPLNSLLRIVENAENEKITDLFQTKNNAVIMHDMSASIQDLQTALEQIETLSVKESSSNLQKHNTEIIETVMESVLKLRNSFELLSTEPNKEEEKAILKYTLKALKENLTEISLNINAVDEKVGQFDVLQSENKLEILQKMAQILIALENNLPRLEYMPEVKSNLDTFHKNLTRVLENVIESNDAKKYVKMMEICETVNIINSSVKNMDSENILPLASLSNSLKIIRNNFIVNVFESELNSSLLDNISDILVGIEEAINKAEEVSLQIESENIKEMSTPVFDMAKVNVILEQIDQTIAAVNTIKIIESTQELKMALAPTLENICPILEELRRCVASVRPSGVEQDEHISEISDTSLAQTLASPICELNQNIIILNQIIVDNIEEIKDKFEIITAIAEPLHELHSTLEIIQHDVISQYGDDLTPYEVSVNMASVVQNLQSCIVMIHEQAGVEGADDMSTLEDISGIKTTADNIPSDHLVLPTAEETAIEQSLPSYLVQEVATTATAQRLQDLNEHITVLQSPEVIEALDTLSEVSDYFSLKSVVVGLGDLHAGLQGILHPVPIEGSIDLEDSVNISKLAAIAEPMQDIQQGLSILDTSNIPIYENILDLPAEKVHSVFQTISEFKNSLEQCMNAVLPAMEITNNTIEISNKVSTLREVCEQLKDIFETAKDATSDTRLPSEIHALEHVVDSLINATDVSQEIRIEVVKSVTEQLYSEVIKAQEDIIQFTAQTPEKLSQEAKLIQIVSDVQNNIAALEQYDFIDLSQASDLSIACISPQIAFEIDSEVLTQVYDIAENAVDVLHDSYQEIPPADLMIVEDFFKTCKNEFTILSFLISKATSHKKSIRLLQEFSSLQVIINNFTSQRLDLHLSDEVNECLTTYLIHADECLRSARSTLIKIIDSQSDMLIKTPISQMQSMHELEHLMKSKPNTPIGNVVKILIECANVSQSLTDNLQRSIINELSQAANELKPTQNEIVVAEKLEELAAIVDPQSTPYLQNLEASSKYIFNNLNVCITKHQDYKDAIGTGKTLIAIKCLAECVKIMNQEYTETKLSTDETAEVKENLLKEVLTEMLQPLQALQVQLINIQKQVLAGADEDSISIDITTTESIIQTMTELHQDIVHQIESDETTMDVQEIDLIKEVDKEIHTIQDSIMSMDNGQVAQVVKEITKPIDVIEKSLQDVLSTDKDTVEKTLPKETTSQLLDTIDQYIELIEIVEEMSAVIKIEDVKDSFDIARELKQIISVSENISASVEIQEERTRLALKLQTALSALHVQVLDSAQELAPVLSADALQRITQVTAQLQANLVAVTGFHVAVQAPVPFIELTAPLESATAVLSAVSEPVEVTKLEDTVQTVQKSTTEELVEMDIEKGFAIIATEESTKIKAEPSSKKESKTISSRILETPQQSDEKIEEILTSQENLMQHINEYVSEDIIEVVKGLSSILNSEELNQSVMIAKELRENVTAIEVCLTEEAIGIDIEKMQEHRTQLLQDLQSSLSCISETTLEHLHKVPFIEKDKFAKVVLMAENLKTDLETIQVSQPGVLQAATQDEIKHGTEFAIADVVNESIGDTAKQSLAHSLPIVEPVEQIEPDKEGIFVEEVRVNIEIKQDPDTSIYKEQEVIAVAQSKALETDAQVSQYAASTNTVDIEQQECVEQTKDDLITHDSDALKTIVVKTSVAVLPEIEEVKGPIECTFPIPTTDAEEKPIPAATVAEIVSISEALIISDQKSSMEIPTELLSETVTVEKDQKETAQRVTKSTESLSMLTTETLIQNINAFLSDDVLLEVREEPLCVNDINQAQQYAKDLKEQIVFSKLNIGQEFYNEASIEVVQEFTTLAQQLQQALFHAQDKLEQIISKVSPNQTYEALIKTISQLTENLALVVEIQHNNEKSSTTADISIYVPTSTDHLPAPELTAAAIILQENINLTKDIQNMETAGIAVHSKSDEVSSATGTRIVKEPISEISKAEYYDTFKELFSDVEVETEKREVNCMLVDDHTTGIPQDIDIKENIVVKSLGTDSDIAINQLLHDQNLETVTHQNILIGATENILTEAAKPFEEFFDAPTSADLLPSMEIVATEHTQPEVIEIAQTIKSKGQCKEDAISNVNQCHISAVTSVVNITETAVEVVEDVDYEKITEGSEILDDVNSLNNNVNATVIQQKIDTKEYFATLSLDPESVALQESVLVDKITELLSQGNTATESTETILIKAGKPLKECLDSPKSDNLLPLIEICSHEQTQKDLEITHNTKNEIKHIEHATPSINNGLVSEATKELDLTGVSGIGNIEGTVSEEVTFIPLVESVINNNKSAIETNKQQQKSSTECKNADLVELLGNKMECEESDISCLENYTTAEMVFSEVAKPLKEFFDLSKSEDLLLTNESVVIELTQQESLETTPYLESQRNIEIEATPTLSDCHSTPYTSGIILTQSSDSGDVKCAAIIEETGSLEIEYVSSDEVRENIALDTSTEHNAKVIDKLPESLCQENLTVEAKTICNEETKPFEEHFDTPISAELLPSKVKVALEYEEQEILDHDIEYTKGTANKLDIASMKEVCVSEIIVLHGDTNSEISYNSAMSTDNTQLHELEASEIIQKAESANASLSDGLVLAVIEVVDLKEDLDVGSGVDDPSLNNCQIGNDTKGPAQEQVAVCQETEAVLLEYIDVVLQKQTISDQENTENTVKPVSKKVCDEEIKPVEDISDYLLIADQLSLGESVAVEDADTIVIEDVFAIDQEKRLFGIVVLEESTLVPSEFGVTKVLAVEADVLKQPNTIIDEKCKLSESSTNSQKSHVKDTAIPIELETLNDGINKANSCSVLEQKALDITLAGQYKDFSIEEINENQRIFTTADLLPQDHEVIANKEEITSLTTIEPLHRIERIHLIQQIDAFISDEVTEIVDEIANITNIETLKESVVMAKKLRESVVASDYSTTETASLLNEKDQLEQARLAQTLQDALSMLHTQALDSVQAIAPIISSNALQKFSEIITLLQEDLATAIVSEVKSIAALTDFEVVDETEERNSMAQLESLLKDVNIKIYLTSTEQTRDIDNSESLKDTLDEVQTVIIKLKSEYDDASNDTFNETLEDLECSVRSVQLQINEESPPELLSEACVTLQLLVDNMNATQQVQVSSTITRMENTENIIEKCSNETDETVKLLDIASKFETKGSHNLTSVVNNLNIIRSSLKSLRDKFLIDADTVIENGVEIVQCLDQIEEHIFALEKDIDLSTNVVISTKDSILTAVHSVYGSISNMRSTVSSVQKRYMFEHYGKPSESLLHSIKNLTVMSAHEDENNKLNLKKVSKSLRKVLNHFEDIKFYINLDKTARLPSDAAFTKIILEELKDNIFSILVPRAVQINPDMLQRVNNSLKCVESNLKSIELDSMIEVKNKIPMFKEIAADMLKTTSCMNKYLGKSKEVIVSKHESPELEETVGDSETPNKLAKNEEKLDILPITDFDRPSTSKQFQDVVLDHSQIILNTDSVHSNVEKTEDESAVTKFQEIENIVYVEKVIMETGTNEEIITVAEMSAIAEYDSIKTQDQIEETDPKENLQNLTITKESEKLCYNEETNQQIENETDDLKQNRAEGLFTTEEKQKLENELLQGGAEVRENVEKTTHAEQEGQQEQVEIGKIKLQQEELRLQKQEGNDENYQKEDQLCLQEMDAVELKEKEEAELRQTKENKTTDLTKLKQKHDEELGFEEDLNEGAVREKESEEHFEKETENLGNVLKATQVEKEKVQEIQWQNEKDMAKLKHDIKDEELPLEKPKEDSELNQKTIDENLIRKEQEAAESKLKGEQEYQTQKEKKATEGNLEEGLLQNQKEQAELTQKQDETINMQKDVDKLKTEEETRMQKEKESVELKQIEMEERHLHDEKEVAKMKEQQDEEIRTQKDKQATEFQCGKEEEKEANILKQNEEIDQLLLKEKEIAASKHKQEEHTNDKDQRSRKENEETELKGKDNQQNEKDVADLKVKENEELRLQKEKEESELKVKENQRKQKEKEEEELRLQREKEMAESKQKREALILQQEKEEAEIKEKKEEELRLKIEKEADDLKQKENEELRLQKEKEESELKEKENQRKQKEKEEEELRLQREKEMAESKLKQEALILQQEKEVTEIKQKKEEELRLKIEKEADDLKQKENEELRLQKEKKESELKEKENQRKQRAKEEEELRLRKEMEMAESKQIQEALILQQEKEAAEIKEKKEEELRLKKEKEAGDLKQKENEELRLQKEKEESELKEKENQRKEKEEEELRLRNEKEMAESKLKQKALILQQEKEAAEINEKKEEEIRLKIEKEADDLKQKENEELRLQKEKEETELKEKENQRKEKEEEELRLRNEKEMAESKLKQEALSLQQEKEVAEIKQKKEEELRLKIEKEADDLKQKENEELCLQKEKEESELKEKVNQRKQKEKEEEELRLQREKDMAESKLKQEALILQQEKEVAEIKQKKEEELRLKIEKEADDLKQKENEELRLQKEKEETELKEKENQMKQKEIEEEELRLRNEKEMAESKLKQEALSLQQEKEVAEIKQKKEEELRLKIEKEADDLKQKENEELRLQKEKEESELKEKENQRKQKEKEEEELRLRKEKEMAESKQIQEALILQQEKEADEIKEKKEEELRLKKEKEAHVLKKKENEELRLQKEKEDSEFKVKENQRKQKEKEEEELHLLKEKEMTELKLKQEALILEQEKEAAEIKQKELLMKIEKEESELKEKENQRKEKEKEELRLQKEKEESELKEKENQRKQKEKEEEELRLRNEKEMAESKLKQEALILQQEKEAAEIKQKKEEELRLKIEKEADDLKQKENEESELKEKENQRKQKEKEEEELRLQREKEMAESKLKQEALSLQQEKEAAEIKQQKEEELRLKEEKEAHDVKQKENEELRMQKEKEESELKMKENQRKQKEKDEEEFHFQKEKEMAELKLKQEALILQQENETAEIKQKKDEELRLQKEKDAGELKQKEKDKHRQKKAKDTAELNEKQNEKQRLKQVKEAAELKEKLEKELLLQKKREADELKQKRKEEKAEIELKQKKEEEIGIKIESKAVGLKLQQDEGYGLLQEKGVVELKQKDVDELQLRKEKEERELCLQKDKKNTELKQKHEDELDLHLKQKDKKRLRKGNDDLERKSKKEIEAPIQKKNEKIEELRFNEEKTTTEKATYLQKKDDDRKSRTDIKLAAERPEDNEIITSEVKMYTKINKKDDMPKQSSKYAERLDNNERRDEELHVFKNDSQENGNVSHNSRHEVSHEQHYIKEYQYDASQASRKVESREKPRFVDHNHRDYTMEFARPSRYRERHFDSDKTESLSSHEHLGRKATIFKTKTLVLDAQLRSSAPPYPEISISRTPELTERHSEIRHDRRSKARSEARSVISEKRTALTRDSKRKPVFSTYLTDRTAVEGSRVKLTCSVLSSSDPTVTWYKNGVIVDNKLKYRTKIVDGLVTLEVLNAIPSDSAEYSCTISNENGSVNSSANLKVYPSFEASPIPPTFTRSIRDTYHMAENELVLECRIRGQPLPTITWLKDDKPISGNSRYQAYYLADGVCRLAIDHPTPDDSGKYTCKAENSVWSDEITHVVNFTGKENRVSPNIATIEKSRFNRQVMESRRPHFTNVLSDYKVVQGGTIGLQVEIRGAPTRVEWLREGCSVTEVYRNAKTFVEQGLYTLALSDVTEKESGMYTCRAWSLQSHVDMNAAITVVQPNELDGRPAIIVGRPEKDILISVGEDVNISFRVQGEPKPKVVFMKGIRDITTSQRVCKMTSDDYVKFTLKRSVISDAGTYCILARNAYGCDRAFVTVVIRQRASSDNLISDWTYPTEDTGFNVADRKYKSVPERIPGVPNVVEGGNNWLSLAWPKSEPGPSAPVLAYKVESWLIGTEGGARWTELGITPLTSFDAFNLKQGEEYHFRVTPRNRYGWGESVQTPSPISVGSAGDRPEFSESLPGQLKVLVGTTANLSCCVKGKPVPEVVWMKNGHEIEDEDRRLSSSFNGFNCCLTIKDINIEDEARYSCEAANVHGRASTYARLAVVTDRSIWEADVKLKRERSADVAGDFPPQFTMRLRDRRVQATYPVRLTCQVIGGPHPTVTWFRDGQPVKLDLRRNHFQDEHFHTLEIAPTNLEDGGVYEVMARNSSGAVSCHCSLVVDKGIRAYVAPEFCCGLEPLYKLKDGEELRITAVVEAYPSVGVTWYRDGVRLRPSRRTIMTLDRDGQIELALAAVTSRDAGVYTCTASNEVGRASTSGKVEVTGTNVVRTPPIFIAPDEPYSKEPMFIRKPRSSEAREGDTVIIACEVVGDPKPDVYWLRDFLKPDYYRDATHFKRVGDGPEYRFEIPHAKLDYTGAYSVVAKNQYGEAKAIISLQILAKDPSSCDDTHNISYGRVEVLPRFSKELTDLLSCDGDVVEFECRLNGNPEPTIKWFHYHELIRDSEDFETTFDEGTVRLKIKQVTAEDEGTYTCEAANNLGKATSSACLVVYPPGEPNTLSQRLRRPPAFLSAASTPRSTPRSTPARSVSRTPGPEPRRLCSPARTLGPAFYTYPFNKVAEEGETVTLQCAIKGNPAPWATWDKDGVILTPSARVTIKEKEELRMIEIEEISADDVGVYRITIENEFGRQEATARIEVITQRGKFYAGVRAVSPSPRKSMTYRSRRPSTPRQD